MLNVAFRVKQFRLSHVHKIFNGTGPLYLSEQFIKVSDVHHHFTRGSTENFIVPSVNGVAATTFYESGIKDWNSLPSDVKQIWTFNSFKSTARQYLLVILTYLVYLVVKLTHYRSALNFCFIEAIDWSFTVVSCRLFHVSTTRFEKNFFPDVCNTLGLNCKLWNQVPMFIINMHLVVQVCNLGLCPLLS